MNNNLLLSACASWLIFPIVAFIIASLSISPQLIGYVAFGLTALSLSMESTRDWLLDLVS